MYDTLMQMGRWFGYRPGYLDLCRLYTTNDLVEWFEHIADAAEELRAEFDFMMESRLTPREYGLKVRSHPVLMSHFATEDAYGQNPVSLFQWRCRRDCQLYTDKGVLEKNLSTLMALADELGSPSSIPRSSAMARRTAGAGFSGPTQQRNRLPASYVVIRPIPTLER